MDPLEQRTVDLEDHLLTALDRLLQTRNQNIEVGKPVSKARHQHQLRHRTRVPQTAGAAAQKDLVIQIKNSNP